MKFKAYHKIKQFRDIIRDISHQANFKGVNENDEAIYEESEKPTLIFEGTVKLHGTNAMVYYTPEKGIMAGKRSSGLSPDQLTAHMGFNQFVQVTKKEFFKDLLAGLHSFFCKEEEQVIIYGEWCGPKIQKGVAVTELPKAFYIFDCKVVNLVTEEFRWLNIKELHISESNVYNLYDFPTYELEIDFNNPGLAQNKLIELTTEVEKECPVSKQLGVSGIGEGIVWKTEWKGQRYIFKVKGEKHSTSKVKTLAGVDVETIESIMKFVEYACTDNRVMQGIAEVEATERKHVPILLKWVANDIIAEEDDVLTKNGLEWKQVAKEVANRTRQIFFKYLDKI